MQEQRLPRMLGEVKRRLDTFDVHSLPSEEFRRAVYLLYEMVRDMHSALQEVEREFDDAYEAFSRIADKQDTMRARELLGGIIGKAEEEEDNKDASKRPGNYL